MNEKIQAWLAIAGAVLGPVAVWWWRYVERRDQRQDKGSETWDKRDERAWQRMEKEIEACHGEIRERDKRIEGLERDRDRGWDLARMWRDQAAEYHYQATTFCRMWNSLHPDQAKIEIPKMPNFRELIPKEQ